jgi:hypothetical protein
MYEHWYRETALPLYGLPPEWPGVRMIGGGHRERRDDHDGRGPQQVGWESLGLGHGNPISVEPWLHVITSTLPGPTVAQILEAERLSEEPDPSPQPASPLRVSIFVEATPIEFQGVESGHFQVGQASVGECLLTVAGARWPLEGLELVRIGDPEPYITGRFEFLRALQDSQWQ